MNYAELSMAISDWANKDQIDKVLPSIIRFGQRDLEDSLRIRPMEYLPATSTVNAGTATLALPTDFLEVKYLMLLNGTTRYPIDYKADIRQMYSLATVTSDTGLPSMIAQAGDNLIYDVKTDIAYTLDWCYYRRLAALVAAAPNNTNWWSESAEEAFLMSCLNKLSLYVSGISAEDKKKWSDAAAATREKIRLRYATEATGGATLRTEPYRL